MALHPSSLIDCVIFDLFGVVVAFDDNLVYDRISQRCTEPNSAIAAMHDLVSDPNLIRGRTSLQQLHTRLVSEAGLTASFQEFERIWSASYSEAMPGVRDLLLQLAGQCRLVLLSNVDPYYWPTVHASVPELTTFHAKVLSFELGAAKPDAQAFKRAVAVSEVPIERCYFVDDKPENIAAGASLGIAGHLFQNCRMLKVALRQVGLRVE